MAMACAYTIVARAPGPLALQQGSAHCRRRPQQRWLAAALSEGPATSGPSAEDAAYMRRALALAARAAGRTHPNPAVGCVLVRGGQVVGEGYHPRAGMPHAEVYALRGAGAAAEGATAYVTLEPCAHHGRTPPCAAALVDARVARVVVGVGDPNPLVSGRGVAILQAAGIEVVVGCEEAACHELNAEFMQRMRQEAGVAAAAAGGTAS